MTQFVTAIVLAAGLSRRMGEENKLLLPFGDSTMLKTTLSQILNAQLGETLLIVGHEWEAVTQNVGLRIEDFGNVAKIPDPTSDLSIIHYPLSINYYPLSTIRYPLSINNYPLTVVINPDYEKGMTTSIQTGVAAAHKESRGYMVCLSDMPFLTAAEYTYLKNAFLAHLVIDNRAIVQPIFKNKRGNPTIFAHFYQKDILALTYTEGCKPIVEAHKEHVYWVEMPTEAVLRDIDSKDDYKKIE